MTAPTRRRLAGTVFVVVAAAAVLSAEYLYSVGAWRGGAFMVAGYAATLAAVFFCLADFHERS